MTPIRRKGKRRRKDLTGQGADSWDVAEYAPYCHLGEALSDVTYTVMYNRYHECVSECICGTFLCNRKFCWNLLLHKNITGNYSVMFLRYERPFGQDCNISYISTKEGGTFMEKKCQKNYQLFCQ